MQERWDARVDKARELTDRTLAWFPIRVWRHFLRSNGFLLAAGISYQSLFAVFAALSLAFSVVGLALGDKPQAIDALIDIVNSYIPNLISPNGLVTPADVQAVAQSATGALSIATIAAGGLLIWTAIGFVTYARRAVREIFQLPFDKRAYLLLKARDLLAALVFGLALVIGAVLGQIAGGAIDGLVGWLGLANSSFWVQFSGRAISLAVAFGVNALALAGLYRFLAGAVLPWHRIWPGSLLGGVALAVVQLGSGLIVYYSPSNPLLATFTVLIWFLLWFRLVGIILLVASAWIAVAAADRAVPLTRQTEAERRASEHAAILVAATVRVRDARESLASAPWYRRPLLQRELRAAERTLESLEPDDDQPAAAAGDSARVGGRK